MKFLKTIITISTFIALYGCGTVAVDKTETRSKTELIKNPPVGKENTAEIGQTMISAAYLTVKPGIEINPPISDNPQGGITTIKSRQIPLTTTTTDGDYYVDAHSTFKLGSAEVSSGEQSGIFVPSDKSKPALIFHKNMTGYVYGKNPVHPTKIGDIEIWNSSSFKRELAYTGISQNTISIAYREFKDDIARPAFTQELKYDLSQGKEIGYRGARFEVIKANNTEITYKVIKPLD